MRQPALIAVPLTNFAPGSAVAIRSANTNRVVSSTPTVAVVSPRVRKPCAISACGFSSSSHAYTCASAPSGPSCACSIARPSSNFGVTRNALPFTGITAASNRSLTPHLMPVKYSIDVPPVSTSASILVSRIKRFAFSMRARRSSTEIGVTPAVMGRSARIAAGIACDASVSTSRVARV